MMNGSSLAAGALHDVRNILTVISGHSELLLARLSADDPLWRSANAIRKAAESGAVLTSQMLAAGRAQEARGEETRFAADAGCVRVNRTQFEQVIMNLAVNARDAMPEGGRLTIETTRTEVRPGEARRLSDLPPGTWATVLVSDTGIGMEPWVAARLFEPYFTTKNGTGTGLGLATAHDIVQRYGGAILVTTARGAGSTFRVYLRAEAGAPAATPDEARRAPTGTETLLLIEDDAELRDLVREILELQGYAVLQAPGADEALGVAASYAGPIDLVIADVFTPGLAPREVVARLRQARPTIKVLYVSGHADEEVLRRTGPLDGTLLRKPFAVGALGVKVRAVLDE
ncbi:MAG: response regulator [Candidatus Rokubacteria bacterium]|nr:response regulator [Candidatus Rokubacteria bacterium]